jgi:biopolymer transport protein ExbB/TolQ
VSKQSGKNSILVILGSLGWPLILGSWAAAVFYLLVYYGPLNSPLMHRYFAGHPVSFVATGMFFVGMAALGLKLLNVLGQFIALARVELDEPPAEGNRVEDCAALLDRLEQQPAAARNSYLGRRLRDALEQIERKGSTEGLDDELKYLADLDAGRQQDGYALVRIIIWATPMLGFLGTVIGITQALGDLNPSEMANAIDRAMQGLLAGLYVAFDTTALALSLSIILMFVQFIIDRIETQLLAIVDARSNEEMVGRFQQIGTASDPHVASVERMSRSVVKATETLVERQSQLWQTTIDAAHQQWSQLVGASGQQMHTTLATALDESLQKHANRMSETEQVAVEQLRQRWEQWQVALSENARLLRDQQKEMVKQGEVLARVLEATGDVMKLEQTLNQNLKALAGSKNFEDTVMSLSAAIHLLNTRLGKLPDDARPVDLTHSTAKSRAA